MRLINLSTQQQVFDPINLPPAYNLRWADEDGKRALVAAGIRECDDEQPIPAGYVATSRRFVQDQHDEARCVEVVTLVSEEQAAADAQAARVAALTPAAVDAATLYRLTLRRHFGNEAETNRDITVDVVEKYFAKKQAAGSITAAEVADGVMLSRLRDDLSGYTADGTMWTFPWEAIP